MGCDPRPYDLVKAITITSVDRDGREHTRRFLDSHEAHRKRVARLNRRPRSIWDRFLRLKRFPTTGWEGEKSGPMDGVGLVIVEVDEDQDGGSTLKVSPIGARTFEVDWPRASVDVDYTRDRVSVVNREYARMGYIEAERFMTILDRLDDIMRGNEKRVDDDQT